MKYFFFYLIWILVLSILRLNTPTKVGRESWSPLYINYVGSGPDPAVRRASAAASRKLLPTSSGTPGCSHQQPECTTIFADWVAQKPVAVDVIRLDSISTILFIVIISRSRQGVQQSAPSWPKVIENYLVWWWVRMLVAGRTKIGF